MDLHSVIKKTNISEHLPYFLFICLLIYTTQKTLFLDKMAATNDEK